MRPGSPLVLPVFMTLLVMVCGCQRTADGPTRRTVEGTVTYQSTPLEYGMIRFVPENDEAVATAIIEKGKYRVTNKGGVPVGTSRVEITASRNIAALSEDAILTQESQKAPVTLPDKYNKNSVLTETIPEGKAPFTLNFTLQE